MQEMGKFEKVDAAAQKEETPEELISRAINRLEEMLDNKDIDEKKVKEQCGIIIDNAPGLYSRDFMDFLPVALRCAGLENKLFRSMPIILGEKRAKEKAMSWIHLVASDSMSMMRRGIIQDLPKKENFTENLNPKQVNMLHEAYYRLFYNSDFWQSLELKESLDKNGQALVSILEKEGTDDEKMILGTMRLLMEEEHVKNRLFSLLRVAFQEKKVTGDRKERVIQFLIKEIEKYGVPGREVAQSWLSCTEGAPIIEGNFFRMEKLEKKRHGIVKFLYQQFGIRNFARYPSVALFDQFDNYGNNEKPYGIILNPLNDYNGAFSVDDVIWMQLHEQLKQHGYLLRIIEAGGRIEIGKRFIWLDRLYGKQHKINFAFIGGHGTKDSIRFGGDKKIHFLHTKDLAGKGIQKSSKFFEKNPTIILVSCSTGAKGGIGENLSKIMDAIVIAPDVPTNIKNVKVAKKGESLVFDIEYKPKEAGRVFRGIKNRS